MKEKKQNGELNRERIYLSFDMRDREQAIVYEYLCRHAKKNKSKLISKAIIQMAQSEKEKSQKESEDSSSSEKNYEDMKDLLRQMFDEMYKKIATLQKASSTSGTPKVAHESKAANVAPTVPEETEQLATILDDMFNNFQ